MLRSSHAGGRGGRGASCSRRPRRLWGRRTTPVGRRRAAADGRYGDRLHADDDGHRHDEHAGKDEADDARDHVPLREARRLPVCDQVRLRGIRVIASVRATIEVREGSGWRVVAREPRGSLGRRNIGGQWGDVWVSPDGRTLLAEWLEECDTHYAFFVPAAGGRPRPVTGERNWRTSPPSLARGWASDGRARVWVLAGGGCSHRARVKAGRYLVDPHRGVLDYAGPLPEPYRS